MIQDIKMDFGLNFAAFAGGSGTRAGFVLTQETAARGNAVEFEIVAETSLHHNS